jgi:repressor LexA
MLFTEGIVEKEKIGEKIKKYRKYSGMTQKELAVATNLSRSYIAGIETSVYNPSLSALELISTKLNIDTSLLVSNNVRKGVKIPVLGSVVAGLPIEAVENILDWEEITPELASTGDFFALIVKGDSMAPDIREGDIVIIKKQETAETGDVAIILVNKDEATIKELHISENGITLIGWNTAVYKPRFYSVEEIRKLPVQILGIVVEQRRRYNHKK